MSVHPLEELFHPRSIAVVGASDNPTAWGYIYTRHLLDYGFKGKIYPVNPRYEEVLGMKAYPRVRDIPEPVDYVISAVPASQVLEMLDDCAQKGVKCVHFYTARFSETGRAEGAALEQEVLKRAKKGGIRLIGPNCMGLYYPREGISFAYDIPKEPGPVGLASQTGGGAAIFAQLGWLRGIRFSKAISYGNALDLNECDFLEYFTHDPETKIILMYVEGVKDGRRFFNTLRQAASAKPVIIIKGGRGRSGTRAAASHTASLSGSTRTWETMVTQAGAIPARNFDEMADLAVSFCFLPPVLGPRVGIAGGGGGPSVLSADECEEAGLDVSPLPDEIRDELKSKGIPIWDWIGNPADTSIGGGADFGPGMMLQLMAGNPNFDLLIGIVFDVPLSREEDLTLRLKSQVEDYIKVKQATEKPFLTVIAEKSSGIENHDHWRWKLLSEVRTKLIAAGIPFYPTMERAAGAARKLIDYYQRRG